jgi:hypothetical protein
MAKNVNGSQVPLSARLAISQSRSSPRAPTDTFPVPMPPRGERGHGGLGADTRGRSQGVAR